MDTVDAGNFRQLILGNPFALTDGLYSFPHRDLNVLQFIRLWAYAALKHPAYKQQFA